VFSAIKEAYLKGGMINADLSEYNILTDGRSLWLIDWPQSVGANHPNAKELLEHDIKSVSAFFGRAYGVLIDPKDAFEYVSGKRKSLE